MTDKDRSTLAPQPPSPETNQVRTPDFRAPWRAEPTDDPAAQLAATLRAAALPILGAAALAGALSYLIVSAQPRVYETSAALISARSSGGLVGASQVTASAVPPAALNQALQGPELVRRMTASLAESPLPGGERDRLTQGLQRQLTKAGAPIVWADLPSNAQDGEGVYLVSARANTPEAAQTLANIGAETLIDWDTARARRSVQRARTSIQQQLRALERDTPDNDIYDAAHAEARSQLLQALAVTGALQQTASSGFELVSSAVSPASPVAPRPLRSALLSALLALLAAAGVAALLGTRRPRPRSVPAAR